MQAPVQQRCHRSSGGKQLFRQSRPNPRRARERRIMLGMLLRTIPRLPPHPDPPVASARSRWRSLLLRPLAACSPLRTREGNGRRGRPTQPDHALTNAIGTEPAAQVHHVAARDRIRSSRFLFCHRRLFRRHSSPHTADHRTLSSIRQLAHPPGCRWIRWRSRLFSLRA